MNRSEIKAFGTRNGFSLRTSFNHNRSCVTICRQGFATTVEGMDFDGAFAKALEVMRDVLVTAAV